MTISSKINNRNKKCKKSVPVDNRSLVGYGMPPDMADGRAPVVRRPPQPDDESEDQLGISNTTLRQMVEDSYREWMGRWRPY